jgi:hypothetical protein
MYNNISKEEMIAIIENRIYFIENDLQHNIFTKDEELSIESPSQIVLDFLEARLTDLGQQKAALIEELNRLKSQI